MMLAGRSAQLRPHCFSVYSLTSLVKMSRPTSDSACSSRLAGSPSTAAWALCSSMMARACAGVVMPHIFEKVFMLKGRL